jgi:hypothetical protein
MSEGKAMLSIRNTKEGVKIEMNVEKDQYIGIESGQATLQGIAQNVRDGEIKHHSGQLTQIGNKVNVKGNGKVKNEAESLVQVGNEINVEDEGEIVNRTMKSGLKLGIAFVVLAVGADLLSWFSFGRHLWNYF